MFKHGLAASGHIQTARITENQSLAIRLHSNTGSTVTTGDSVDSHNVQPADCLEAEFHVNSTLLNHKPGERWTGADGSRSYSRATEDVRIHKTHREKISCLCSQSDGEK